MKRQTSEQKGASVQQNYLLPDRQPEPNVVGETKSFVGVSRVKEKGRNEYGRYFPTAPKSSNFSNLHKRLVSMQRRKPRQAGGVAKENNISRSAENAPSDHA